MKLNSKKKCLSSRRAVTLKVRGGLPSEAMMASVAVSISLPVEIPQQLASEAEKQGRQISWIVCTAVLAHLSNCQTLEQECAEVSK